MTQHEARDLEVHINHCLELLRQSLMCNPDTSLTTFTWSHTQTKPVLDVRRFKRQCVDWDTFMGSVAPRVIRKEDVEALVNPIYESPTFL
ncbi:hypothetical protein MMC30_003596 [Trapelia coarctata]|nr:hypothetical protein [Trapelia coarctata]